ncbi:MAG: SDR family oxidoreductase [Anaerolineales bacterium]
MRVLFIGGTGLISSACVELALQKGMDVTLLNRATSTKYTSPPGARLLTGDIHADPARLADLLHGERFDTVIDFIAYTPSDIQHRIDLFHGKTGQYIFISSASAYQKPPARYLITEDTPLHNPYWQYSRDKIACEDLLLRAWREQGFPATIIRPSLTYGPWQIPIINGSWQHPWTIPDRIRRGQKIIVPGDGTSLWVLTWNGDFAKGLVGLLGREETLGHAFHITSDEVLTWNQVVLELGSALRVAPNIVHIPSDLIAMYNPEATGSLLGDKSNSAVFDNSKIKRYVPGFRCEVRWAEGVRRAIAWFEADPSRQTIDHEANALWDKIIAGYERAYP